MLSFTFLYVTYPVPVIDSISLPCSQGSLSGATCKCQVPCTAAVCRGALHLTNLRCPKTTLHENTRTRRNRNRDLSLIVIFNSISTNPPRFNNLRALSPKPDLQISIHRLQNGDGPTVCFYSRSCTSGGRPFQSRYPCQSTTAARELHFAVSTGQRLHLQVRICSYVGFNL